MRFRHGLCTLLFLSAGCNVKHPEKASGELKPSELAANENKSLECVEQLDTGAEVIALTEQRAKEMGLTMQYQTDPGFDKWCVLFHDIPGNPPYGLEQKRLLQPLADRYYPLPGSSPENILISKNWNQPTGVVVSARGYLPGEKITVRLSAKDAHREVTFYPRPLILKKHSGEVLAKGTLNFVDSGIANYTLDICGVGKQEKYKLISYSGEEVLSLDLQGPISCGHTPEVAGMSQGIAKVELQLSDGVTYSLELPWGYELHEYFQGNK